MTPSRLRRVFSRCSTVSRAIRAHDRLEQMGQHRLAEAMWCHAMALRSPGYPASRRLYAAHRDELVGVAL